MALKQNIIRSFSLLFFFHCLLGILYPLAMTGLGTLLFKEKVAGSLVDEGKKGSLLIGQSFTQGRYFWGRPTKEEGNLSPQGPLQKERQTFLKNRADFLKKRGNYDKVRLQDFPAEMLMPSGSGVDPHISPEGALGQVERVLKARGLGPSSRSKVFHLLDQNIEASSWGILGKARVNVLKLNLSLDQTFP